MGWIEDRADEAATALRLELGRRLGGRYNGAWLASRDGVDVVLKPLPPDTAHTFDCVVDALSLVGTLRQRRYPIPRYEAVVTVGELTVTVQELVAGAVPAEVDLSTAVSATLENEADPTLEDEATGSLLLVCRVLGSDAGQGVDAAVS